jgi:hypothetical protein
MSQKSSLPQLIRFVSGALPSDTRCRKPTVQVFSAQNVELVTQGDDF